MEKVITIPGDIVLYSTTIFVTHLFVVVMPEDLVVSDVCTIPGAELRYRFSRSQGPGGQHVNKVETKVTVVFDLPGSSHLTLLQKQRLSAVPGVRRDAAGRVLVTCQSARSRSANVAMARDMLRGLISKALSEPRVRWATKATQSSKLTRLHSKKLRSATKQTRGRVRLEEEEE